MILWIRTKAFHWKVIWNDKYEPRMNANGREFSWFMDSRLLASIRGYKNQHELGQ